MRTSEVDATRTEISIISSGWWRPPRGWSWQSFDLPGQGEPALLWPDKSIRLIAR